MAKGCIVAIAILIAWSLLFVFVADALSAAVSCDHYLIVSEYIAVRERQETKRKKHRKLRQRYLAWRQWRKDDVRERVHRWAVNELGTHESGGNYLPRYDAYGIPWCAAFVGFCVGKAEDGRPVASNPNSTSSWRAAIRAEVRGLREVVERRHVLPGDIVTFPYGHCGIVHKVHSAGFWAIEGNSSDRVALRFHPWSAADSFGRVLPVRTPDRFEGVAP